LIHLAITAGTSHVAYGPLCLHAVANTPAGRMELVRSYDSIRFGRPRTRGGSAPALVFSRPAQRSLTLRPACSPSRQCDPLHRRLQQLRCLRRCFDCYRVERTSSRAGLTPAVDHHLSRRTRVRDLPGFEMRDSKPGVRPSLALTTLTYEARSRPKRGLSPCGDGNSFSQE
jgi:hypothetical protein